MREGWEYKTFGEVGTFLRGKSIQKADFVEHGLPCIHYGQIHTKFGVSVNKHLSEIPEEVYNKSIIASPGDIVIAITSEDLEGSCKSTAWLGDYDVAVSSHAAVYKHNLNPKFIAYYLRSNSFYIEKKKYARGFKVMEIKPTDIARIPIPVPSEKIQSRVVSELDKINELIRLKKEQLKDYDNLAQSIFYEMFGDPVVNEKGWDVKKLGEEYKVSSSKRIMQDEWTTEGVPFLKVSDVVSKINGQNSEPSTFISETTYSKLVDSNAVPVQNDILITSRGTLGLCYIVKNEDRFYFQDGMITWLAECKGNITPLFLTYLFKNHHFLQQITSKANKSTVAYISISQISKRKVPLPPLALQNLFAQRIELIEQQKAEIQSTIADLETLLASRMQYWFD